MKLGTFALLYAGCGGVYLSPAPYYSAGIVDSICYKQKCLTQHLDKQYNVSFKVDTVSDVGWKLIPHGSHCRFTMD